MSAELSLSGLSLCPATSKVDVDLWGEHWRSGVQLEEFGEAAEGLELILAEGVIDALLLLSGWVLFGRAEPFNCTWTGVMMTVA